MARSTLSKNRLGTRQFDYSLVFNSLSDYVALPLNTHLKADITSQFCAMAWFKPLGVQINSNAIFIYPTATASRSWAVEILSNNKVRVSISNGSTSQNHDSTALIKLNDFNFIAGQYKQGQLIGNYLNGTYSETTPTINNVGASAALNLHLGNSNPSFGPLGMITQVLILKDVCSQAQLDRIYYDQSLPTSITKAAYYQFTNGSGTTLTDSSGNANHATITGLDWTVETPFKSRVNISSNRTGISVARSAA